MNDEKFPAYAALVLRLSLGSMYIAHGLLKVFVFTLPGTAQFFASVGITGWLAYPVTIAEIVGGVLLVSGIATRYVSIALLPVLFGALSVHAGNGWLYTNANGGWEYTAFLIAASVGLAFLGDGAFALRILPRSNRNKAAVAVSQAG